MFSWSLQSSSTTTVRASASSSPNPAGASRPPRASTPRWTGNPATASSTGRPTTSRGTSSRPPTASSSAVTAASCSGTTATASAGYGERARRPTTAVPSATKTPSRTSRERRSAGSRRSRKPSRRGSEGSVTTARRTGPCSQSAALATETVANVPRSRCNLGSEGRSAWRWPNSSIRRSGERSHSDSSSTTARPPDHRTPRRPCACARATAWPVSSPAPASSGSCGPTCRATSTSRAICSPRSRRPPGSI